MLVQRDGEWKLISKKDPSKVLKNFGKSKPSEEAVAKEEARVEYFKHLKESKPFQQLSEAASLAALNKLIQSKVHKDLKVIRGNGYYYYVSDTNDNLYDALQSAKERNVFMNNFKGWTDEQWLEHAKEVFQSAIEDGKFNESLNEVKVLPWNDTAKVGWWRDQKYLTVYHGTNIKHLDSVLENGINVKDPVTGMISLALEPSTARGYAAMGGEYNFRSVGAKAQVVPMNQRVVFVFKIPMSWIEDNLDPRLGGNIGMAKDKLTNKDLYDKWTRSDSEYYQLTELRVKQTVPAKFIVGYMLSK